MAVAATGKNMQKPHKMFRKILALFDLQNLSEVNESSGKKRGSPETGIAGECL